VATAAQSAALPIAAEEVRALVTVAGMKRCGTTCTPSAVGACGVHFCGHGAESLRNHGLISAAAVAVGNPSSVPPRELQWLITGHAQVHGRCYEAEPTRCGRNHRRQPM